MHGIALGKLKREVQNRRWDEMVNLAQVWHSGLFRERKGIRMGVKVLEGSGRTKLCHTRAMSSQRKILMIKVFACHGGEAPPAMQWSGLPLMSKVNHLSSDVWPLPLAVLFSTTENWTPSSL